MKHLIATTALALMMSTSSFAAGHLNPIGTYEMEQKGDIYASKFIGMRVYATEKDDFDAWNADTMVDDESEKEWDDIGEVNDVILGRDGKVKAVILGVGGFIGIGEKDVAVSMQEIKMVQEKDNDDFFLVVKTNKDMLNSAKSYQRTTKGEMKAENEEMAKAEKDEDGRTMLMAPTNERDGYREAKMEELTADKLQGARVYGLKDEDVGEIGKLVLDDKGQIKRVVIDVGGFLGMGEKEVAVSLKELRILRDEDGDDVRVYIDSTQEQLEAQPAYKS